MLEYLKCWFVSTFAHSPIREELMKLLDAKGENDGSLGFKVIVGHPWCLNALAMLWNWIEFRLWTECASLAMDKGTQYAMQASR